MTAVPKNPRVSELRELFRHLNAFRAVFEDHGLEDITTPEGALWSIWDLEYLVAQLPRLTQRQQQAITLCLIHNMRERDAAEAMGVSPTNPVMMYASLGLQRLLDMVDAGELGRYREQRLSYAELATRHHSSIAELADRARRKVRKVAGGCWVYPNPSSGPPTILLRTDHSASGFVRVSPLRLLFEVEIGPMPEGSDLVHTTKIPPFSVSCINPYHAELILPQAYKDRMQRLATAYVEAKKRRHLQLLEQYLETRKIPA